MRIIDKRTDYYDNVVPFSPEPVWVRKEIEFRLGKDNPFKISKDHIDRLLVAWDSVPTPRQYRTYPHAMVCVGGRFYIIFYGDGYLGRPQDIISADRPSKFVKKWNDHHKDKSKHIKIDKDGDGYFYWKMQMFNDKNIKQWYSEHRYMSFTKDLHLTFRSPLFMITRPHMDVVLTINPLLLSIGAQTVLNPWNTYMELDRYIGNDMVDSPLDSFEMSDELKRDSKGMDKWSFKQRGPKARKQKKRFIS